VGFLSTMRARLVAAMVLLSLCFLAVTGVVVWSMLGMGSSFSVAVAQGRDELVPALHVEGDVRNAESAGWAASFAMYGGAPSVVRGEYDDLVAHVTAAFGVLNSGEVGFSAEESAGLRAAEEHWRVAVAGFETALEGDFADESALVDQLGRDGDHRGCPVDC